MRQEINEPRQWRYHSRDQTDLRVAKSRRYSSQVGMAQRLPAELVDAAFADETTCHAVSRETKSDSHSVSHSSHETSGVRPLDFLRHLSDQLVLLEAQRDRLQRLLADD